jgi:hypothetical protein
VSPAVLHETRDVGMRALSQCVLAKRLPNQSNYEVETITLIDLSALMAAERAQRNFDKLAAR